MKLTADQIKTIADEIEGGMIFNLNPTSGKIITSPDFSNSDVEPEWWEETIKELEENEGQLIRLSPPRSDESFRMMEDFTSQVNHARVKGQLLSALVRKSPFRNFRNVLDENGAFLDQWYNFKSNWYKKYVMAFLDAHGIPYEPLEIATTKTKKPVIGFHNKTFTLLQNSAKGTANDETVFYYDQEDDELVTATYYGGSIRYGTIVARLEGEQLHMRYQCLTTSKELKSGKAIAQISFDKNGRMLLSLDWQWLTQGGETGTSIYAEE